MIYRLRGFDDLEHNTRDGPHIATPADSWIALNAYLVGTRDRAGM